MFGRYTAHDLKPAAVPDPVLRCAWVFAGTVSGIFAHIVWYSFFFHLWGGTFRFRSLTGRTFWRMRIFFFGRYRDGFRKSFCYCVLFRTGCRLFRFSGRSHGSGGAYRQCLIRNRKMIRFFAMGPNLYRDARSFLTADTWLKKNRLWRYHGMDGTDCKTGSAK